MKQFIYDLFCNYTPTQFREFQTTATNLLPTFSNPDLRQPEICIWGYENNCFWTLNGLEATLFEPDGTFHFLGIRRQQDYYNTWTELYTQSLKDTDYKFAQPISSEVITLDNINADHPGDIAKGSQAYFLTFKNIDPGYGFPPYHDMFSWPEFSYSAHMRLHIDYCTWIFKVLTDKNLHSPTHLNPANLLRNDNGYFMMRFDPVDNNVATSKDITLQYIELGIGPKGLNLPDAEDILNYARHQWSL